MKIKILSVSLLFTIGLTACGQNSPTATNQSAKPTATVSATTSPANSAVNAPSPAAVSMVKNYDGQGTVTKIDMKIGSVELDHEEIKELKMPAMRMEFYVADPSQLQDLKIGDKVVFVLEDNAGAEKIVSIKKSESKK